MTPRKELFIKTKQALGTIPQLELVDLQRGQFDQGSINYPDMYTAALIRVNPINYETMTQGIQEGTCSIDVFFYCKDGWMDQHQDTADPEHGLIEIDLLDVIAEKLQFLTGDYFKPLQQTEENEEELNAQGILCWSLSFSTIIYRRMNERKYNQVQLNPKKKINGVFN